MIKLTSRLNVLFLAIFLVVNACTAPQAELRIAAPHVISRVIDGDTVELRSGQDIRIIGIDTPERGRCGFNEATDSMKRLVLNKRVILRAPVDNTDRYGRLLRYVIVFDTNKDVGLAQIRRGYAIARYDSRDGYDRHPREDRYHAVDEKVPNFCE